MRLQRFALLHDPGDENGLFLAVRDSILSWACTADSHRDQVEFLTDEWVELGLTHQGGVQLHWLDALATPQWADSTGKSSADTWFISSISSTPSLPSTSLDSLLALHQSPITTKDLSTHRHAQVFETL